MDTHTKTIPIGENNLEKYFIDGVLNSIVDYINEIKSDLSLDNVKIYPLLGRKYIYKTYEKDGVEIVYVTASSSNLKIDINYIPSLFQVKLVGKNAGENMGEGVYQFDGKINVNILINTETSKTNISLDITSLDLLPNPECFDRLSKGLINNGLFNVSK